jgi:hemerythrin-like metal-binding protein
MANTTADIFPWRENYSVGIPEIDTQHKGLIRLISNLQEAMMEGKGKASLSSIVDELIHYTESHFAFEEAMLQERGYAGLAVHQEAHKELTRQVYELQKKLQSGEKVITMDVMRFVKNWLPDHIMARDQAYAKELKK